MKEFLVKVLKKLSELDFIFQANAEKFKDKVAQYWRATKIILKKIPFVAYIVKQRNKLRKAYKASEFYKKKEAKINKFLTPEVRKKIWDIKRSFVYKFAPRVTAIFVACIIALVILNNTSDVKKSSASGNIKITAPSSNEDFVDTNKEVVSKESNENKVAVTDKPSNPEDFIATEDNSKWLENAKLNVFSDKNYITKKGYKFYLNENKKVSSWLGVDVSAHQGVINWVKVKKAGIKFAMIRVGARGYKTGKIQFDQYFKYNIENAKKNGIRVGVYFFSQAINTKEALEEANFVLNCIKGYDLDMPVVFDQEYAASESCRLKLAGLTNEERTDIAITFLEQVKKNGYYPMFYANKVWLEQAVQLSRLNDYAIWYARYNGVPDYKYRYHMWQYTKTGKIAGIDGNVDINVCLVNFDKYIK